MPANIAFAGGNDCRITIKNEASDDECFEHTTVYLCQERCYGKACTEHRLNTLRFHELPIVSSGFAKNMGLILKDRIKRATYFEFFGEEMVEFTVVSGFRCRGERRRTKKRRTALLALVIVLLVLYARLPSLLL